MLLKNELKKLYIKQYGLVVLLIVFIVKLLTSADLYKASYSDMSYEQQKYYLEYMQEYGGQLTDEKETAILSLYSEAEAAKQLQSDILDKNRNGDYATPEEFTNAMREIPDIIEKYDAIKLLYSNYERVSADRENLLMLPSGSNAMTSGIEYLFIMAICYISAAMCYYERKMLSATQNAKSGKRRDKPKLSGINQHKADCYAVCCVSQVVYPARFSKVSCQKNRCVFASIFLYLLKRRSILNNRFKLF